MKRITFKVAKAIKEAGYPQHSLNEVGIDAYDDNGEVWDMRYFDQNPYLEYYSIVTYLEVWLWLWRKKEIDIDIITDVTHTVMAIYGKEIENSVIANDPEEAIEKAIEYLVDNNLIK